MVDSEFITPLQCWYDPYKIAFVIPFPMVNRHRGPKGRGGIRILLETLGDGVETKLFHKRPRFIVTHILDDEK